MRASFPWIGWQTSVEYAVTTKSDGIVHEGVAFTPSKENSRLAYFRGNVFFRRAVRSKRGMILCGGVARRPGVWEARMNMDYGHTVSYEMDRGREIRRWRKTSKREWLL